MKYVIGKMSFDSFRYSVEWLVGECEIVFRYNF